MFSLMLVRFFPNVSLIINVLVQHLELKYWKKCAIQINKLYIGWNKDFAHTILATAYSHQTLMKSDIWNKRSNTRSSTDFQEKTMYLDNQNNICKKSRHVVSNTNYSNHLWNSECLRFLWCLVIIKKRGWHSQYRQRTFRETCNKDRWIWERRLSAVELWQQSRTRLKMH